MANATVNGAAAGVKLTRKQIGDLYVAVVAAATGRLMQGKPNREEREVTAHEAHQRGLVAIHKAQNGAKRSAGR